MARAAVLYLQELQLLLRWLLRPMPDQDLDLKQNLHISSWAQLLRTARACVPTHRWRKDLQTRHT